MVSIVYAIMVNNNNDRKDKDDDDEGIRGRHQLMGQSLKLIPHFQKIGPHCSGVLNLIRHCQVLYSYIHNSFNHNSFSPGNSICHHGFHC